MKNCDYVNLIFVLLAIILLLFCSQSVFLGLVIPIFLVCIVLYRSKTLHFFTHNSGLSKNDTYKHIIVAFVFVGLYFFSVVCNAKNILNINSNNISQLTQFSEQKKYCNIKEKLSNIFKGYNTSKYEEHKDILEERPCDMENRFAYILVSINSIEETNSNIANRANNLSDRRKKYIRNLEKINRRKHNANLPPLIVDIPMFYLPKTDLKTNYENILIYGEMIQNNIQSPNCTVICSFNHIDKASFKIVEEVDNIRKMQDAVNLELTNHEKVFDDLENIQRKEEQRLIAIGY